MLLVIRKFPSLFAVNEVYSSGRFSDCFSGNFSRPFEHALKYLF
jgi:hypothetical protein